MHRILKAPFAEIRGRRKNLTSPSRVKMNNAWIYTSTPHTSSWLRAQWKNFIIPVSLESSLSIVTGVGCTSWLCTRLEVVTVVNIKITVFWDITPCSLIDIYRYFGETCFLRIQSIQRRKHLSNRRHTFSRLPHVVTSQRTVIFMVLHGTNSYVHHK
jgi:hypothetical protein